MRELIIRKFDKFGGTHNTIFAVVATVIIINSYPNMLPVAWGDSGLAQAFVNPLTFYKASLYAWNPLFNTGGSFPNNGGAEPAFTIFGLFGVVTNHLFGSPGLTQAIATWAIHFFAMFYMYKFLATILPVKSRLAAFNGALAYDLSVFLASTYWRIYNDNTSFVTLIPFTLYVAIKLQRPINSRIFRRLVIESIITLSFFAPALANLAYVPSLLLATVLIITWSFKYKKGNISIPHYLKRFTFLVVAVILVNAWYLLPVLTSSLTAFGSTGATLSNSLVLSSTESRSIHLALLGLPNGSSWVLWGTRFTMPLKILQSPVYQVLTYGTLAAIVLSSKMRKQRSTVGLAMGLYFFGLLVSQGETGPTGSIFRWFFANIPFFTIFRIPTQQMVPFVVVGYAIGIACSTNYLISLFASKIRSKRETGTQGKKLFAIEFAPYITSVIIVVLGWPLTISGSILTSPISYRMPTTSTQIRIPDAYDRARALLQKLDTLDYRTLILPLSSYGSRTYKWSSGGTMTDQSWLLFDTGSITGISGSENYSATLLNNVLTTAVDQGIVNVLKLSETLGTRYVLVDHYTNGTALAGHNGTIQLETESNSQQRVSLSHYYQSLISALQQVGAQPLARYGSIAIYQLPTDQVRPIIFLTNSEHRRAASQPLFSYRSPIQFSVSLKSVKYPSLLVLNQSWDPGWHLIQDSPNRPNYANLRACFKSILYRISGIATPLCAQNSIANTAASQSLPIGNYWPLRSSTSAESYQIVYMPQLIYGLARIITLVSVILLSLYWTISKRKKNKLELNILKKSKL